MAALTRPARPGLPWGWPWRWLLLFLLASTAWAQSPPSQATGYNLSFSESFSPLNICSANVYGCNWYFPGLYNFGATGTITNPTGYANLNWTTAENYTTDMSTYAMNGAYGQAWTFGYFEVSAAFNNVTGSWPAIFLEMANYNKNSVQTGPEIDLFEWQSNTPTVGYSTLHTWNNGTDLENNSGSNTWSIGAATLSSYNTYGVLWTPTYLKFYFNNALVETVSTTSGQYANYFAGQYPAFLALQQSAGCNFVLNQVTPCSGQVSPLNMQVQWVHVFSPPGTPVNASVETYGPVPALQPYNGLGQNLGDNSWEYSKAQAAHITWGRYDCGWVAPGVEIQNLPANTSGGYTWPTACSDQLTYSSTYSIHPIIDALFGPPYGSVGTLTTNTDSPPGTTVVHVTGSLTSIVNGQTAASLSGGSSNYGAKGGPYGVLITAAGSGTITLASALTTDLPSGSSITLNLLLYPPVAVPQGGNYMTNPSVIAYGGYVNYMAGKINAAGLTGQVSLWNEPANGYDPWDHAANLYDTPPPYENISNNLGMELPLYVASLTMPAGVTIDNGYTEVGGGSGSILAQNYGSVYPWLHTSLFQAKATIGTESFHPYETNPESDLWQQPCLAQNSNPSNINNIFSICAPTGSNTGSNFKLGEAFSAFPTVFGGNGHSITETGLSLLASGSPTNTQVTRYDLRVFLGYQGLGVTPVVFYRMYNDAGLQWCTSSSTCYPVLTAFSNLMTDIGAIASTPVAPYSPCMMPRVSSYNGYYPLATVMFVGSQSGNKANSILYFTWQKSYSNTNWVTLASPSAVNVSVVVPTGLTVSSVKNTNSGSSVSYTFTSGTLTYAVADDPIEVLLAPTSSSTAATLSCT